ncbi:MAG: tetratricopeptide repeat protein [Thermodesulfobacteriota bacterium]
MQPKRTCFFLVLAFQLLAAAVVWGDQQVIDQLGEEIKAAQSPTARSRLHIYRARQYCQLKDWANALEDYNLALELNHQGWIHLERSGFFMVIRRYELAYEDARAAKDEVPTLAYEADKVMTRSLAKIRKEYEAQNPQTIIMDSVVDPNRKTRFDVAAEQGVFATNAARAGRSNSRRRAARKQREVAAASSNCGPGKKTVRRG